MDTKIKSAIADTKDLAHKIGDRKLPPHLRVSIANGRVNRHQASSDFDVDDFLERQRVLEELQKNGVLEKLIKTG
ncbi:hypothetical protein K9M47_01540 [Candidatus Gracilibacteria bacterium]|nr:hypothetical protein [Candidatus Gracilibacteria bacterium]